MMQECKQLYIIYAVCGNLSHVSHLERAICYLRWLNKIAIVELINVGSVRISNSSSMQLQLEPARSKL